MKPGVPTTAPTWVSCWGLRVVGPWVARPDEVGDVGLAELLGEAPVDHDGLAELADQDVVGLEVAVDDALGVGEGEGLGDRQDVGEEGEAGGRVVAPRR
jgi:hypothetical protein